MKRAREHRGASADVRCDGREHDVLHDVANDPGILATAGRARELTCDILLMADPGSL
jgi:hypothetical protein